MSGVEVLKAVFGIDVDTAWHFQICSDLVAMAEGHRRGLAKAENWFMTYAAAPNLPVARRAALFNLNSEVIWLCSLSPISGLIADV